MGVGQENQRGADFRLGDIFEGSWSFERGGRPLVERGWWL